ncbi:hypothetical protein BU23DRAFT_604805 [Bimuria novae-zelandiae CBS 107.79]|uniref:HTH CENPB-type domain-containing protein n=1 Tax=Bimuria novae-zelandiae CBS 107.79 TaxID=1447943 RepID=A0A6A5UTK8_9PLEO|nr:hypothetical protein BU23DRAFT_604805 [Bimuria novae-zelandiae CBS 107.79]
MAPIDDAIAAYNAQEPGKKLSYGQFAKMFSVSVTTLRRRQQGSQQSRTTKDLNQRALSPQQEQALLQHIDKLTERRLPPTREMMRNFASVIAHQEISESWVSRFLHRNNDRIVLKWSKAMDAVRHHADSYLKYRLYFNLLHEKMAQYNI